MVGPPHFEEEASYIGSTQEENQEDNTSMTLRSPHVLSMPMNLTEK